MTSSEQSTQKAPTSKPPVGLYIVCTPIGNLNDITLRALSVLSSVDFIYCEDTRTSKKLLDHHGITTPTRSYHDHSTPKDRQSILFHLQQGKSIALISDVGTPLISDPGYKLVSDTHDAGFEVYTIPGACAATAALSISGLPTDTFYFAGFPPTKLISLENHLHQLSSYHSTIIFYETSRRLVKTLSAIEKCLNNPHTAIARELTKKFEEVQRGTAHDLISYYTNNPPKGECVIVIDNRKEELLDGQLLDNAIIESLKKMSVKDTVDNLRSLTSLSKSELYSKVIHLKES